MMNKILLWPTKFHKKRAVYVNNALVGHENFSPVFPKIKMNANVFSYEINLYQIWNFFLKHRKIMVKAVSVATLQYCFIMNIYSSDFLKYQISDISCVLLKRIHFKIYETHLVVLSQFRFFSSVFQPPHFMLKTIFHVLLTLKCCTF